MSYTEKLLPNSYRHGVIEENIDDQLQYTQRHKRRGHFKSAVVHALIFLAYAGMFSATYIRLNRPSRYELEMVWSPGNEALHYRPQYINNDVFSKSVWKGEPRPEHDEAWENLFNFMNIRVSKEELDRMNQTSIQLSDGSGDYLAGVDVLHHLHCVKLIRHYIFADHYELGHSKEVSNIDHIDHCLDSIRQQLMCRAEASMYTYEWRSDISYPWAQLSYEHTCADFDAILEWASTRAVDIGTPGLLDHPESWRFAGQSHSGHH